MRYACKVLFYIKRNARSRSGRLPIMGRVTISGQRAHFSTQLWVTPEAWDVASNCAIGRTAEVARINRELESMRRGLYRSYDELLEGNPQVRAEAVRDHYLGQTKRRESILHLFAAHNERYSRQVGINRSHSSLYKYEALLRHLRDYLRRRRGLSDLPLAELSRDFVVDFHGYLLRDAGCHKNTVCVYLTAMKHVIGEARHEGLLSVDPFADYRLRNEATPRAFLTEEELARLIALKRLPPGLRLVRDIFLFSCFTGLSFVDLKGLAKRHIVHFEEHRWIEMSRKKTGNKIQVRLSELPLAILEKYSPEGDEPFFSLPSNSWCNRSLFRLMHLAEIPKRITFHAARHTFATTLTLAKGMSIESISKLLGHSSIRTTQIYANITRAQLDREFSRLSPQLDAFKRCWKQ